MGRLKQTLWISAGVFVLVVGGIVTLAETGIPAPLAHPPKMLQLTDNLNTSAVGFTAPAGELINAATGQVLYENNILAKRYPASIVKLMTSLIALKLVRKGQLTMNSIIPVSQSAYHVALTPGLSVAYLNPTEHITLARMLEYMYVVSADDAAVAIADAIGGNQRAFARMMNQEAKRLGLSGTHYVNASGLQNSQEYTTVRDVGILSRHLIEHYPIVLKYASMRGMYIHPGQYGTSYNQLLGQYQGLDGLKTGSTSQAGYCFVGTAVRHGVRLISVLMGMKSFPSVFQGTSALLDYGFNQWHNTTVLHAGQPVNQVVSVPNGSATRVEVAPRKDVVVALPNSGPAKVTYALTKTVFHAPVRANQAIGMERIAVNGHEVLRVPVFALKPDPPAGIVVKVWRSLMTAAHHGARYLVHLALARMSHL